MSDRLLAISSFKFEILTLLTFKIFCIELDTSRDALISSPTEIVGVFKILFITLVGLTRAVNSDCLGEYPFFSISSSTLTTCGCPGAIFIFNGGLTESIIDHQASEWTRSLRLPDVQIWANALEEIVDMSLKDRDALAARTKMRARMYFGMEAMAQGLMPCRRLVQWDA